MADILKHKYQLNEKERTVNNIWVNEELVQVAAEFFFKGESRNTDSAERCLFYSEELSREIEKIKNETQPIEKMILISETRSLVHAVEKEIELKKYKSVRNLKNELYKKTRLNFFNWRG